MGFVNDVFTKFVPLTPEVGPFTAAVLIYFQDLQELDISCCQKIDANLFCDCIVACKQLKKLIMVGCKQFSEYQVVKFVPNLPMLRYFDLSKCAQITYCSAYVILSNLHCLQKINMEPKDILQIRDSWKNLIRIFRDVHFGVDVMRYFQHYGISIRMPAYPVEN